MLKKLLFLFFILLALNASSEEKPFYNPGGLHLNSKIVSSGGLGFNLKVAPVLFWKTLITEFEYPLSSKFSIGLNVLTKFGRTDWGKKQQPIVKESLLENGLRFELALKYFITGDAPTGFYVSANGAWGNLIYFDGNVRPYTFHNHWKNTVDEASGKLLKPFPFSGGIGAGYQLMILPKHIIANLMIGAQANFDNQQSLFISLYAAPSIGIIF